MNHAQRNRPLTAADGLYFRAATPEDRPFIVDTWAESYKFAHAAGLIPMPHFQLVYRNALNWILDRPGTEVVMAVGPEDVLIGWIGVDRKPQVQNRTRRRGPSGRVQWVEEIGPAGVPLVLFVYVKTPFREMGIGRQLFEAAGVTLEDRFLYASKLVDTADRVKKHAPLAQWAPLAARFPKV